MKKIGFVIILIIIMILAACNNNQSNSNTVDNEATEQIFKDLSKDQVKEIKIHEQPLNKDFNVPKEQLSELIDIIKKVEVTKKITEKDLVGEMVEYEITNKDSSAITFQKVGPYLIINDQWYTGNDGYINGLEQFTDKLVDF